MTVTGNPNPGTPGTITYDVTVMRRPWRDADGQRRRVRRVQGAAVRSPTSTVTTAHVSPMHGRPEPAPYTVTATYSGDDTYASDHGSRLGDCQPGNPTTPTISNLPTGAPSAALHRHGSRPTATAATSVVSNSTSVCTVVALDVSYRRRARVRSRPPLQPGRTTARYSAPTTFTVGGAAADARSTITNLPTSCAPTSGGSSPPPSARNGDGTASVVSPPLASAHVESSDRLVRRRRHMFAHSSGGGRDATTAAPRRHRPPSHVAQAAPSTPSTSTSARRRDLRGSFTASVRTPATVATPLWPTPHRVSAPSAPGQ